MYIEHREFPPLEPGEYMVKVESVQQTDSKYGNQLRFMLRVLHAGGELSDAVLMAWASPTLTPKIKLTREYRTFFEAVKKGVTHVDAKEQIDALGWCAIGVVMAGE